MALLLARDLGCLPAFALALALIEDRSPIIHKEFNQEIVDSFISKKFNEKDANCFDYDLRLVHNKMKEIFNTKIIDGNSIIIKNIQKMDEFIYNLFQKIQVKIVAIRGSTFIKLMSEIIF